MKTPYINVILGSILIVLFSIQPGLAQISDELKDLRKELEELKQSQKGIQKDLQEIKSLLQSMGVLPEEPENLFFNIAGKPIRGNKNAKLILIEFSEYQ
jgi:septation ring formation regulator EzrA